VPIPTIAMQQAPADDVRYEASSEPHDNLITDSQLPARRHTRSPGRATPYHFRIPSWFSNKVWELSASRSRDGWALYIQTWNHMPNTSPACGYFLAGDVKLVRNMFQAGLASPYDVYGDNTTLEVHTPKFGSAA